jgi:hypothetical protein
MPPDSGSRTPITNSIPTVCHNIPCVANSIDPVAAQQPKTSKPPTPGRERASHSLSNAWRYATADFRARPYFVIIGAQRSGTTSLFKWLSTHPDVSPPTRKEIHYFDVHYGKGPRWYRAQFPFVRRGKVTGEGSPYMLYHPLAPARAARDLPSTTRFIALLRDPVQRTVSDYWTQRKRKRFEPENLARAIALEPERLAGEMERVMRGEISPRHSGYSYVSRGEYAGQLEAWFDAVGRDRILIVESESLYTEPATAAGVVEWLDLAPHDHEFPVANKANRAERWEPEDPRVLAELTEYFKPHNQKLFELLGYELWTGSPGSP